MKFIFITSFFFIFSLDAIAQSDQICTANYQHYSMDVEEAYGFLNTPGSSEITIIDIRSPKKYDKSHIKGAMNIYFYDNDFNYKLYQLEREPIYFIYSDEDSNSYTTILMMEEMNFVTTYFLEGGFKNWRMKGYPVTKTN